MLIEQTLIERARELANELEPVAEGGMDHAIVATLRSASKRIEQLEAFAYRVADITLPDESWFPDCRPPDPTPEQVVTEARELFENLSWPARAFNK